MRKEGGGSGVFQLNSEVGGRGGGQTSGANSLLNSSRPHHEHV